MADRTDEEQAEIVKKVIAELKSKRYIPDWYHDKIYGQTITHLEAETVKCPHCEADPQHRCRTNTGWRAKTHAKRIKLAKETLGK